MPEPPSRSRSAVLSGLLLVLSAGFCCTAEADADSKRGLTLPGGGRITGSAGAAVNATLDQNGPDAGLAWGFAEATATTPRWHGLSAGVRGLAVGNVWSLEPGDFEQVFTTPTDLRDLYLELRTGSEQLSASLGRRAFPENPVLDGDSQQGVGVSLPLGRGSTLNLAALNHWIRYSRTRFNARGITGWRNVDKANDAAGSVYIAASVQDISLGNRLKASPFLNWQEGVMAVLGSTFDLSLELPPSHGFGHWNSELIVAYHRNRVPPRIEPDYGDVWSARLHSGLVGERFSIGAGVYWLGNGRLDLTAGLFDVFDPLEEDDLYPFDDRNHAHLFYLDGSAKLGKLTLTPALGVGRNDAVGADSIEVDLFLDLPLTRRLSLAGYAVYVDFSEPVETNYYRLGTELRYSF